MEIPTYSIFEFHSHSWMVGKTEWIPNFTLLPLNEPRKVTVYWPEKDKDKKSLKPYIAKLVISKDDQALLKEIVSLFKARKITVSQVLGFGKLNVTEIKEKISAISQPPNDASIGRPTNSGKGSLTGSESKLSHLRQLNMKKSLDSLGNSEYHRARVNQDYDEIKTKCDTLIRERQSLEDTVASLRGEVESLKAKAAELERNNDDMTTNLKSANDEIDDLRVQLRSITSKYELLDVSIELIKKAKQMKNATHIYYNEVNPFPANVQVIEPNTVAEKSSPKKRKIEDDQIPLSDWENEDIKSPPPESMVTFTEAPEYTETTDEDMESEDDASQGVNSSLPENYLSNIHADSWKAFTRTVMVAKWSRKYMALHVITGKKAYGLAIRKRPIPQKKITEIIGIVNRYWAKKANLSDELIIDLMREKLANEWTSWKKTPEGKKWLAKNGD